MCSLLVFEVVSGDRPADDVERMAESLRRPAVLGGLLCAHKVSVRDAPGKQAVVGKQYLGEMPPANQVAVWVVWGGGLDVY